MGSLRRELTVVDRTVIEVRRRDGWGIRRIALALGRSGGTISDEIKRHSDTRLGYLAVTAEEVRDTAAGDFAPSLGTAEIDRLSCYDFGNRMALGRRVGIHEQGHELFVGSRIGRHDVGLKANERDHFLQIPFRGRALFKGSLDQ